MSQLLDHLRSRARILLFSAALAVLSHWATGGTIAPGEEGLRSALGAQVGGQVLDLAWEPTRSILSEWVWGRPVLFLAQADNAPRELHRGFVRLSPEGSPLSVTRTRNLSRTDLGDEDQLTVGTRLAVFRSRDAEGRATLSLLDLGGAKTPGGMTLLERLQLTVTRLLHEGDTLGLGRTDLIVTDSEQVRITRQGDVVQLTAGKRSSDIPIDRFFCGPEDVDVDPSLVVLKRSREPEPLLHWAANVGRDLVGPALIARLEELVFQSEDWFSRTRYAATHSPAPPARRRPTQSERPVEPTRSPQAAFPPAPLESPWPDPRPGEGVWVPAGEAILGAKDDPPLFYRTFVRPDPERPYAEHLLVVMDMSRLELGIRAGYEDPRPQTGPPGSGHVPKEPAIYSRIVATFNGAFKLDHGAYGMKAEGRVLIPAVEDAATVLVDASGRVGIGSAKRPSSEESPLHEAIAFRQNLDLLIEGGKLLPTGRKDWGDHLISSGTAAERTGLCVTEGGHLLYAWGREATARTLARGMQLGGCRAAMHLDMNPGHCAFSFNRIESFQPLVAQGEPLSREMRINPNRFLRWSPKDFFYLARRDAFPRQGPLAQLDWQAAVASRKGGLPAVVVGQKSVAGIALEIDRVDLDRVSLSLLPRETTSEDAASETLAEPPVGSFSWSLGHATRGTRTGLSLGAMALSPLSRKFPTLVLKGDGKTALVKMPGTTLEARPHTAKVQLPLLARDGELTEEARRLTGRREHGALCLDRDGYLLIGRMQHDTPAPLVMTLLELGCDSVLETDRGSHSPARAFRPEQVEAGEEEPSRVPGPEDGTLLIAELRPAQPRAYTF